jgi:catechol 2,3-dioxygenase-like lactoylglutathione lyase family enzyme
MIASFNVASLEAHRRFWLSTLGAVDAGARAVELPGLRIETRPNAPAGGTRGTPLDHLGFQVPDLRAMVARVRAAGYPIVTRDALPSSIDVDEDGVAAIPVLETFVAFTVGPDEVTTEFLQYAGPPIALHHVHLFAPDPAAMRDWYVRALGAVPTVRGRFLSGEFAGVRLSFSQASWPLAATRGRAIERVTFEVPDGAAVEAAAATLEGAGATIDRGPSGLTVTDPSGTAIEIRAHAPPSR